MWPMLNGQTSPQHYPTMAMLLMRRAAISQHSKHERLQGETFRPESNQVGSKLHGISLEEGFIKEHSMASISHCSRNLGPRLHGSVLHPLPNRFASCISFPYWRLQSSAASKAILARHRSRDGTKARCIQKQAEADDVATEHQPDDRNGSLGTASHDDYGEVNRILASRVVEREMQYLIEWKDDHPDTWEPPENIARDVLTEYVTPWWQAARKADENKLAELLQEEGRDVNAVDENGRTALLFAAGLGSESCVRLLVEEGADLQWQDQDGFTALHIAAGYVHSVIVKTLLELGADPELEDSKGRTALKLAQDLLDRIPKANPLQFARRLALDQVVKLLDEASFEAVAVEQILDKRIAAGNKVEYLVKWSDDSEDSWLPARDVAEDLVRDFEAGLEYGDVQKILDKRVNQGGQVEYLVKWADSDKDSWEPQDNLTPEVVEEFEQTLQAENKGDVTLDT